MRRHPILLLAPFVFSACGEAAPPSDVVAEAAGRRWTAEQVVALLAPDPELPADPEVIRSLAELWIDYTLLATAGLEDTTMGRVDMSTLVEYQADEMAVEALRREMIRVDLSDEVFERRYDEEAPDSRLRVRHLVLAWPDGATPAERDSLVALSGALRDRIVAGEDFAGLVAEYSDDAATAGRGGEVGWIVPGMMLPSFDEAAFALETGEVSEPVRTSYGVHLIRVEERGTPTRDEFRTELSGRLLAEAESLYIAGLEERYAPEVVEPAPELIRAIARDPRTLPAGYGPDRTLVGYRGGRVTAGEVQAYMQAQTPQVRNQVARSADGDIPAISLRAITHRELLVTEAGRQGYAATSTEAMGMAESARRNLAGAAKQLGLVPLDADEGEDPGRAVDRTVNALLGRILTGEQRRVTPLGPMSYVLRVQYPNRVFESGVQEAVTRVAEARVVGR